MGTEKRLDHRNALRASSRRSAVGGLDAEAGDPSLMHVLEKVAIVRGNLDHIALWS